MIGLPRRPRPALGLFLCHIEGAYQQLFKKGFDAFYRQAGCDLIVFSDRYIPRGDGPARMKEAVYRLADKSRLDGLCVDSSAFPNQAEFLRFMGESPALSNLPIVLSSMDVPGFSSVCPDNAGGMRAVLAHLREAHGAERIAFAGGPAGMEDARIRCEAWRAFLDEQGLPFSPDLEFHGDLDTAGGRGAARHFLSASKGLPDAIAFANDEMAIGGIEELRSRGIRVPEDLLVSGFDDINLSALQDSPLATAHQPVEDKAKAAAELLLNAIRGYPIPERVQVPVSFVPRATCGCKSAVAASEPRLDAFKAIMGMKQVAEGMGSLLTLEDLCREFSALFPSISQAPAFVCLYDEDKSQSFVVAASDGNGASLVEASAPRRFVSSQLVPAYLLGQDRRRTLIMQSLYRDEQDFGFLACCDEGTESDVFVALRFQTSAALDNILLLRDIESKGKRLEEALAEAAENERKYRELADLLPAFVMESAPDGRVTYLNAAGLEMLGLPKTAPQEGRNLADFVIEVYDASANSECVRLRVRSAAGKETSLLAKKSSPPGSSGRTLWIGLDFKPALSAMIAPDESFLAGFALTPREREILALELEGYIGKEIADKLSISLSTVKGHVGSMYRKLGIGSRDQLFSLMRERVVGALGYDSLLFSLFSRMLRD